MSKKLFKTRFIREVFLKDGKVLKYVGNWSYLQYGEVENNEKEITDWCELLEASEYGNGFEGYTDRKNRIWCDIDYTDKNWNRCQAKVYKENFEKARVCIEVKVKEPKDVRMKDLVNELNAEEFILFLKDNEIKYVGGF